MAEGLAPTRDWCPRCDGAQIERATIQVGEHYLGMCTICYHVWPRVDLTNRTFADAEQLSAIINSAGGPIETVPAGV